ncbi:MAG: Aspartate-semialdehyde dehydrogenase [Thermoanaerobaculia bacterium]|nr:Aspartate-semialdehyde dehydrogenase [Thermoanaerobaculia bacterium]
MSQKHPLPDKLDPRVPIAVIGATGAVGQRMVSLLAGHPWFRIAEVAASERSQGKKYSDATRWILPGDIPEDARDLTVVSVEEELSSPIVLSAVDASVADEIEPLHASRGKFVVSNTKSFRMKADVPLLVPEVNSDHLALVERQSWRKEKGGAIITNPNCVVVGLAMGLAPLHRAFGLEAVTVVTLQALSGAGYPGVPSLDAQGNVIPFIDGEEEKIEREPGKILGLLTEDGVIPADFKISVAVNRVPVRDGHTESVFVKLKRKASLAEIKEALEGFTGEPQALGLPFAPAQPIVVRGENNRPQPVRDVETGHGMVVTIGRLRPDPVYDVRFTLLVHNTVRGAAGAALLNAELLLARGLVPVAPVSAA